MLKEIYQKSADMVEDYEITIKAIIYMEIRDIIKEDSYYTDDVIMSILDTGYNLYMKTDYSTPTGIGCSFASNLQKIIENPPIPEEGEAILSTQNLLEILQDYYYYSDWR